MGFFRQALGLESRGADYIINPSDLWARGLNYPGVTGAAGEPVSTESVLGLPTAWRCIQIISDTIAGQEIGAFLKTSEGVYIPTDDPDFLGMNLGVHKSKATTLGSAVVSLLLVGNAYFATTRDRTGKVLWIEPLNPSAIEPYRVSGSSEKRFKVNGAETDAEGRPFTEFDILHIPGLVKPGELKGCSPLTLFIETFSRAQAANKQASATFGNGNIPAGILEVEGDMTPAAKDAARHQWDKLHKGAGNSGKIAIITHNAKFKQLTMNSKESQFLESRQFDVNEMARIYGVPTSLLAHSEGPEMGKSVEDKRSQFSEFTLGGWFMRLQDAFTWLALSEGGNPDIRIRFNREELERGNFGNYVTSGVQLVREGVITVNEFRASLGKPPVSWGDEPISVQVQDTDDNEQDDDEQA